MTEYKIIVSNTYRKDEEKVEPDFWKKKKLEEMSCREWELLCDGCGKCCLNKLDIDGKICFTCVKCRFLDSKSCLCRIYESRFAKVPDCRSVNLSALRERPKWLPKTCAYRLLEEGKDLPEWHPLVSGNRESVHRAMQSVRGRLLISETEVRDDEYENYIVDWKDI
ncbi:MAG: YcgN family cysteine cluster protein [Alphaproteobacteria bacterium]|nr:YcgN family cysteine cluster protein [Alphaproteobacteria bacterium]